MAIPSLQGPLMPGIASGQADPLDVRQLNAVTQLLITAGQTAQSQRQAQVPAPVPVPVPVLASGALAAKPPRPNARLSIAGATTGPVFTRPAAAPSPPTRRVFTAADYLAFVAVTTDAARRGGMSLRMPPVLPLSLMAKTKR
jgi:hypothetical protein